MARTPRLSDYCKRCGGDMSRGGHADRYYCPKCGEVRCGWKRRGKYTVHPHYRHDKNGNDKPCVGGEVDPKEDRAP